MSDKSVKIINHGAAPFGCAYFLAIIGTAVYFCQQASGFWGVIGALLKSLVWPAFFIHRVFQVLGV